MLFDEPIAVDDSSFLLLNRSATGQLLYYDPSRRSEKLRVVTLNLPAGNRSGGGLYAGDGLFLPLDSGRAILMDPQTGAPISSPFQPPSDPVGSTNWTNPVVLPDDPDQVVLADSRKKLYRLRVGGQIKELASVDLEKQFRGRLASVDKTVIGVIAGPAADFVVGHNMSSLKESFKTLMQGRVVWGPYTAGDTCFVQTGDKKLRAVGKDGSQAFSVALPAGKLVGKPVVVDSKILFTGAAGWIVALDAKTGELVGTTQVGQPIAAEPLVVRNQMLVPGAEGVIYIIPVPGEE